MSKLTAEQRKQAAAYFGRKGGEATARKLNAQERKESARKAAKARWAKKAVKDGSR